MSLVVRLVPLVICASLPTVLTGTAFAVPAGSTTGALSDDLTEGVLPAGSSASVVGGMLTVQANPGYDNQITVQPGTVPIDVGGVNLHTYQVSDGQLIEAGTGCIQSGPIAVICSDDSSNPITGIQVSADDGVDSLQIQDQDPTGAFVGSIPWAIAYGGNGDDTIVNFNQIYGENGSDYLILDPNAPPNPWNEAGWIDGGGDGGNDYMRGNTGDNYFKDYGGSDTVDAGAGDDTVSTDYSLSETAPDSISLGDGNDYAEGGGGNDSISLGAGDDIVHGYGGDDTITSGGSSTDDDWVNGRGGNDRLVGGPGRDELRGSSGADTIIDNNSARPDLLFGESGADYIDSRSSLADLGDSVDCGTEIDVLDRDSDDTFANCETVNTY